MNITQDELETTWQKYKHTYEGCKEDYFALLYLAKKFDRKLQDVAHQTAFGGRDYGLDAFHFDINSRNLYLFQFKWSENHRLFVDSLERLANDGMRLIFESPNQDAHMNPMLVHLQHCLHEHKNGIDSVRVQFVFNGELDKANNSQILDASRERLESQAFYVKQYFKEKPVSLVVEFLSNSNGPPPLPPQSEFSFAFQALEPQITAKGETLHVGFVSLMDLCDIYNVLKMKFLERNIRAALSDHQAPNRALRKAFGSIVLRQQSPQDFVFNHNGVTLAVGHIDIRDGKAHVSQPRLLNGAQTVTSLATFIKQNERNKELQQGEEALRAIRVLAKIISHADPAFVTNATICNNQQNAVEPWHLRANDLIQLKFEDKFQSELKVFYERLDKSFKQANVEELEEKGIATTRAIEMRKLAQTFLALQGEVERISNLRETFGNEKIYKDTFREDFLKCDIRQIVLAYKIEGRLNSIVKAMLEKTPTNSHFLGKAGSLIWSLLIQGVLNDKKLSDLSQRYGKDLVMSADYSDYLRNLASTRIRLILQEAVKQEKYKEMIAKEKYSFLRTKALHQSCMEIASRRYGWQKKSL